MPALSLIICRYRDEHFARLSGNLDASLVSPAERVVIDNRCGDYDLFTAYNAGIERATGDYLCFLHEDLYFRDAGWDARAVAHFERDPGLGMIGVAGGRSVTWLPRSWTHTYFPDDHAKAVIEPDGRGGFTREVVELDEDGRRQVLLLDGVFLCVRRSLVEAHGLRFDDGHFAGFHRYDYDFCMQVARHARIAVVGDIAPQHFSAGVRSPAWLQAAVDFQRKYNDVLPCGITDGEAGIRTLPITGEDHRALVRFALNMRKRGFSRKQISDVFDLVLREHSALPYELRLARSWLLNRRYGRTPVPLSRSRHLD